eukprot:gnl/Spiro4/17497_TR9314_c0_g1_i1.p1 gnl/Spiro4/17497_TR9314_c0_g1~~gnl/Spiro4/17497_TR9314_c0_g1_i1.p1  ORF type:complete len:292 (+),score=41.05 gnl/Spiro4/17497_TR9314_c0_g1_i1:38-877(+)
MEASVKQRQNYTADRARGGPVNVGDEEDQCDEEAATLLSKTVCTSSDSRNSEQPKRAGEIRWQFVCRVYFMFAAQLFVFVALLLWFVHDSDALESASSYVPVFVGIGVFCLLAYICSKLLREKCGESSLTPVLLVSNFTFTVTVACQFARHNSPEAVTLTMGVTALVFATASLAAYMFRPDTSSEIFVTISWSLAILWCAVCFVVVSLPTESSKLNLPFAFLTSLLLAWAIFGFTEILFRHSPFSSVEAGAVLYVLLVFLMNGVAATFNLIFGRPPAPA